ncbi:Ran-binding protein 9 [Blyttiomyces sp. JEL0837]|nr:Ran-binding protein 9 [Blyttiomyces sp. JEL0837]
MQRGPSSAASAVPQPSQNVPSYLKELCTPAPAGERSGARRSKSSSSPIPLFCQVPSKAFVQPDIHRDSSESGFGFSAGNGAMDGAMTNEGRNGHLALDGEAIPTTKMTKHQPSLFVAPTQGMVVEDGRGGVLVFPSAFFADNYSDKDNHSMLHLSEKNLRVAYAGPGSDDIHAASIRANHPIPPQCGIYYFEVTVISKGRDGWMGIGLCEKDVDLNRLPGWDPKSWGYHGDDGYSFESSGRGKSYGPTYTTGDIIGCCINFRTMNISYTKNGLDIGVAFKNIKPTSSLFPVVGMRTPGEILEANFGGKPFKFDVDTFVKDERLRLWSLIAETHVIPPPTFSDPPPLSAPADMRRALRSSKTASLLNNLILSYLKHNGYVKTSESFHRDVMKFSIEDGIVDVEKCLSAATGTEMDVDGSDQLPGIEDVRLRNTSHVERKSFNTGEKDNMIRSDSVIAEAIRFGREIRREFYLDAEKSDSVRNALEETFSLLAYDNPAANSPTSYLLTQSGREIVANIVDGAVLSEMGCSNVSDLEQIVKQAVQVNNSLIVEANGCGALLHVERDFLVS